VEAERMLPEEHVTFQVALVGSDGVVIGSDRKVLHVTPVEDENPIYQRTEQPKYKKDKLETVACFYAGGADSAKQASNILRASVRKDADSWESVAEDAARQTHRIARKDFLNEILIVRKDAQHTIWLLKSNPPDAVICTITTHFCTGTYSDARFLVSRLWRPGLPVAKLKNLALLALAYATKDNSGNIGGSFDIMTMGSDQQFRFEHYELSEVDRAFAAFHEKLTAAFEDFSPVTASSP
jgi:hypothetical protein